MDQKTDPAVDNLEKNQKECPHKGNFNFGAQQILPDSKTRTLVFINTIMCKNCGYTFQQTLSTNISIAALSPFPMPPMQMPNFKK